MIQNELRSCNSFLVSSHGPFRYIFEGRKWDVMALNLSLFGNASLHFRLLEKRDDWSGKWRRLYFYRDLNSFLGFFSFFVSSFFYLQSRDQRTDDSRFQYYLNIRWQFCCGWNSVMAPQSKNLLPGTVYSQNPLVWLLEAPELQNFFLKVMQ